jgi:hypothetical protein
MDKSYLAQFDAIKCAVIIAPVLATMGLNAEFILHTNASNYVIGAVLAQYQL